MQAGRLGMAVDEIEHLVLRRRRGAEFRDMEGELQIHRLGVEGLDMHGGGRMAEDERGTRQRVAQDTGERQRRKGRTRRTRSFTPWRRSGPLALVSISLARLLLGRMTRSLPELSRWVARQLVSITRLRRHWEDHPVAHAIGPLIFSAMPENRSASVLCSARPRTMATTPDVAMSVPTGTEKTSATTDKAAPT